MGLLLYKSNEMFSATQLIRQSKMIFDKIVNNEIDKAIILRDGKPGFLLMDFEKYEKIMADYERLKSRLAKQKKIKSKEQLLNNDEKKPTIKEALIAKTKPSEPLVKENIEVIEEDLPPQTVEEEISQAMKSIDSMNFDEGMKNIAKEKIRAKILAARKEREQLLKEQQKYEKEQLKEELKLQAHIKEEKKKKEQELKEFWD